MTSLLAVLVALSVSPAAAPAPAPDEPRAAAPAGPPDAGDTSEPAEESDSPPDPESDEGPTAPPQTSPAPTPAPAAERGPVMSEAEAAAVAEDARALRDDLFAARARAAVVASKLFRSKISVSMRSNLPRFYEVADLVITLDGAPVYMRESGMDQTGAALTELFAAPGTHTLGVSAELTARRDPSLSLRVNETFTIIVPDHAEISARVTMRERGNMWRFSRRNRGTYHLRTDLKVRAKIDKKAVASKPPATAVPAGGGG